MELISLHSGYEYKNEAHSVESAAIQFHANDIYINPDFTAIVEDNIIGINRWSSNSFLKPVENHKIHIFFNLKDIDMVRQIAPGIINGSLTAYVAWAHKVTKRKVIIHIPKSNQFMKKLIVNALSWVDGWELVCSKNSYSSIFYVDDGSNVFTVNRKKITYLILTWFMDNNVLIGLDTRDKRGLI